MNLKYKAIVLTVLALGVNGPALSDGKSYMIEQWENAPKPGVPPVDNQTYLKACGGCHFAYQPGLLPALSWERIMADLKDHFGANAEIPASDVNTIRNYLLNNAAGRIHYEIPARFASVQWETDTLPRITTVPYFVQKHGEIPAERVSGNPRVQSFSRCDACHTQAAGGSYGKGEIDIPGYGRIGE